MRWKTMLLLAALCAGTAGQAQDALAEGTCTRLAAQTGLKRQTDGSWRANMLGGLGAALFGGSAGATFGIEPVEGSTAEQALDKACAQNGAALSCRVVGPARIVIGTKSGNASADVGATETVEVGMKGRYLTCREVR